VHSATISVIIGGCFSLVAILLSEARRRRAPINPNGPRGRTNAASASSPTKNVTEADRIAQSAKPYMSKRASITVSIGVGSLLLNGLRHINIYGLPGGPMDAFGHFLVVVTAASTFYYCYLLYVGEVQLGPPGDED
jgi:hypothetical protein